MPAKQYDAPPALRIETDRSYKVSIDTDKGAIELELFPQHAPKTVNNFVFLAQEGFYDGVTFHRVEPNFVVQGGDPRGDGWGGPGYAIRTETSLESYERGSVGMASSGKDTEGCQFFITHLQLVIRPYR